MTDLGKTLRTEDIEGLIRLFSRLYGKPENGWHEQHYLHQTYSKGDIIYITCRYLLENDVPIIEASRALEEIYILLQIPVRWPYEMNHENDALTRREYRRDERRFNRLYKSRKPFPVPRLYRTRTGMTRDPYIYYFAACVEHVELNFINWTTIPYVSEGHLVYRPLLWAWHKALITGKRSRLYELLERKPNHKDDYVNLLRWYRKQAYERRVK